MKKQFLMIPFLLIGLLFALPSCQYEWIEFEEVEIPDEVSLQNDLVPIFEAGCNSSVCHGGSKDPDLRAENVFNSLISGGYVDVDNPEQSSIYTSIVTGGSMAQYAQPGNAELVLAWIEQGAKDN